MAIQNDNTILNKGDLKAYHEKILPYLSGNIMMSTNNSDYYSTDEKIVGVWTDGKPLYQRVIDCGAIPAGAHNGTLIYTLNDISHFHYLFGYTDINGVLPYTNPYSAQSGIGFNVNVSQSKADIILFTATDRSAFGHFYLCVQYTKTTDAAGSATAAPGAYDINFPNTWPENTEIYFGNGLYGQRLIGTISVSTSKQDMKVSDIWGNGWKIKSCGGNVTRTNNNSSVNFPVCNDSLIYHFWNPGTGSSSYPVGIYIENRDGGTMTNNYDVWVTYTK